jgi:hypothetical protein
MGGKRCDLPFAVSARGLATRGGVASKTNKKGGVSAMKYRVRNFFFGAIVAAALFSLGYTLWLDAQHRIDFLQALFSMEISVLSALWFGFRLNDTAEEGPVSIRDAGLGTMPRRESSGEQSPLERQAA